MKKIKIQAGLTVTYYCLSNNFNPKLNTSGTNLVCLMCMQQPQTHLVRSIEKTR